ncbi:MAG TPA: hypothetical protein VGA56_07090 [Opitutaceae bacterium]
MSTHVPVLELDRVLIESDPLFETSLCGLNFVLGAGELVLVLLDREHMHLPLADAASGLVTPIEGAVRFGGRDWQAMSPDEAAARRGRIGRLFAAESWVANLDVDENITLSQRHHTRRPEEELIDEAVAMAYDFLLPGLPLGRPSDFRRQDLQKAACIRAFLGEPALILLERPTRDIYADIMAPLANALFSARRRGAAVIWTTEERRVWEDAGLRPTRRALMSGARLHFCESDEETL